MTAEEVFKMASDGKINFEQFEKAMTSAAGNVAFEMGNTLPGAFANAQAALGRFGAKILAGIYPALTKFFLAFQQWMKPVEAFGKVIGAQIGAGITKAGEAISAFAAGFKSTMGDGKSFTVTFEIIREEIARFASAFQTQRRGHCRCSPEGRGIPWDRLTSSAAFLRLGCTRILSEWWAPWRLRSNPYSPASVEQGTAGQTQQRVHSISSSLLSVYSQLASSSSPSSSRTISRESAGSSLALGSAVTAYKGVTTAIGLGKSTIESYNTAMGAISSAKDTVMGVAEGFKMLTSGSRLRPRNRQNSEGTTSWCAGRRLRLRGRGPRSSCSTNRLQHRRRKHRRQPLQSIWSDEG